MKRYKNHPRLIYQAQGSCSIKVKSGSTYDSRGGDSYIFRKAVLEKQVTGGRDCDLLLPHRVFFHLAVGGLRPQLLNVKREALLLAQVQLTQHWKRRCSKRREHSSCLECRQMRGQTISSDRNLNDDLTEWATPPSPTSTRLLFMIQL